MKIITINQQGDRDTLSTTAGTRLMELLRDEQQSVEAVCGGCCACATCHVWLDLNQVGPRSEQESELLSVSDHFDPQRSRLSCQVVLDEEHHNLVVTIAPEE